MPPRPPWYCSGINTQTIPLRLLFFEIPRGGQVLEDGGVTKGGRAERRTNLDLTIEEARRRFRWVNLINDELNVRCRWPSRGSGSC